MADSYIYASLSYLKQFIAAASKNFAESEKINRLRFVNVAPALFKKLNLPKRNA